MVERWPGGEERALLTEDLEIERRDRTARLAVQHHHPAPDETVEPLGERRLSHRVVDDLHARAPGEALHFLLEVALGVEYDLVRPGLTRELRLCGRRHRPDHAGAAELGDLAQQQPDASRRRVDKARVTRLQGIGVGGEVMRGHPLEHQRSRLPRADVLGERNQTVGRDHRELGVSPEHAGVGDAIAELHVAGAGSHLRHGSGRFLPGGERQRYRVQPAALIDVDEVHSRGGDLQDHLPGPRLGRWHVLVLQHLGTAGGVNAHRLHRRPPPPPPASAAGTKRRS